MYHAKLTATLESRYCVYIKGELEAYKRRLGQLFKSQVGHCIGQGVPEKQKQWEIHISFLLCLLFYSGLPWIGWWPLTLGRTIYFPESTDSNANLIQRYARRHIQKKPCSQLSWYFQLWWLTLCIGYRTRSDRWVGVCYIDLLSVHNKSHHTKASAHFCSVQVILGVSWSKPGLPGWLAGMVLHVE